MKAYEIPLKVNEKGTLELPEELLIRLQPDQLVRVIILISEPADAEEQASWSRLTAEQFLAGYSEADAVYDDI